MLTDYHLVQPLGKVVMGFKEKEPIPPNEELVKLSSEIKHEFKLDLQFCGKNLKASYEAYKRFEKVEPLYLFDEQVKEEALLMLDGILAPSLRNSQIVSIERVITPEVSKGNANAGWPWNTRYPTKRAFWEQKENVAFMHEVWDYHLLTGAWWPFGQNTLKKERRPKTKIEQNRLRSICMADVVHTCLMKCLWWDMQQKLISAGFEKTFIAVGFNPWQGGIQKLASYWGQFPTGWEFDVGKMDANLHEWVIMMLTGLMFTWLDSSFQTADNKLRAFVLSAMVCMLPIVMDDGWIYLKGRNGKGGNLSGQFLTTFFNSLFALFLLCYSWALNIRSKHPRIHIHESISLFRKCVCATIVGDDITYTLATDMHMILSGTEFARICWTHFGIELETPSDLARPFMELRFIALGLRYDEKYRCMMFTLDPNRVYSSSLTPRRDGEAEILQSLVSLYVAAWGTPECRVYLKQLIDKWIAKYGPKHKKDLYTPWHYAINNFYPDSICAALHTGKDVGRIAQTVDLSKVYYEQDDEGIANFHCFCRQPRHLYPEIDDNEFEQRQWYYLEEAEHDAQPICLWIFIILLLSWFSPLGVGAEPSISSNTENFMSVVPYAANNSLLSAVSDAYNYGKQVLPYARKLANHIPKGTIFSHQPTMPKNRNLSNSNNKKLARKHVTPAKSGRKILKAEAKLLNAVASAPSGMGGGRGPSGASQVAKQIMTRSGVRHMASGVAPKARWNLRNIAKRQGGRAGLIRVAGVDLIDGIKWSQIGNSQTVGTAITIQGKSQFVINPFTVGVNRLATFAGFYEKYEFKRCMIEWIPSSGTDISGFMVGAWDIDVGDTLSGNKNSAYKTVISQPGYHAAKFYQRQRWSLPKRGTSGGGKDGFFTNSGNATDIHFVNQANFNLLIGAPAQNLAGTYPSTGDAGQLFLHYVCDFWAPEDNTKTQSGDAILGFISGAGVATGSVFGTTTTPPVFEGPGTGQAPTFQYDASNNLTVTLPAGYSGWVITGSLLAATSVTQIPANVVVSSSNIAAVVGSTSGQRYTSDRNVLSAAMAWQIDSSALSAGFSAVTQCTSLEVASTITFRAASMTIAGAATTLLSFTPVYIPQISLKGHAALQSRMRKLYDEFSMLAKNCGVDERTLLSSTGRSNIEKLEGKYESADRKEEFVQLGRAGSESINKFSQSQKTALRGFDKDSDQKQIEDHTRDDGYYVVQRDQVVSPVSQRPIERQQGTSILGSSERVGPALLGDGNSGRSSSRK